MLLILLLLGFASAPAYSGEEVIKNETPCGKRLAEVHPPAPETTLIPVFDKFGRIVDIREIGGGEIEDDDDPR